MKTRYFKTNNEYFKFIHKYKNRLIVKKVCIRMQKIKVKYKLLEEE